MKPARAMIEQEKLGAEGKSRQSPIRIEPA